MISLSALQAPGLQQRLQQTGRVQIEHFLQPEFATALAQAAAAATFRLSVNSGEKSMDLALDELSQLTAEQQQQMTSLIHQGAKQGFQYCFDTCRLSDLALDGQLPAGPLLAFYQAMNSPAFLAALRQFSADPRLDFCDAQITRYRPGHFLTMHDDGVAHKHRRLAFVMNLTLNWRADWGGLLLFPAGEGRISEGFVPAFNTLNLFTVPQPHLVSLVAPFADASRISITGWVRSQQ
jgi:Rps23 Pro-64 3,4-dihydroxylase Tpa1-like proline 4-hydroxylase